MSSITVNGTTWADVEDYFGSEFVSVILVKNRYQNQRKGQAFMNALSQMGFIEEYRSLTGSPADPFHGDTIEDILIAFDYLLEMG